MIVRLASSIRLLSPLAVTLPLLVSAAGCQSPTSASDVTAFADAVTVSSAPEPILADGDTGGRTYRVVRGNNQPDDILPYDWHAVFSTTLTLNSVANSKDLDIDWPLRLTATQIAVKQASAGIITPPTGGDAEHSEYVTLGASANSFSGVGSAATLTFETWYDLPSQRKEAVVQMIFTFEDADGTQFSKSVNVPVAP